MCGILFYQTQNPQGERKKFEAGLKQMDPRGPDYHQLKIGENYIIGHTRLAIIDLSADANQPFYDSSGRFVITYNGEIYNYKELRDDLIKANFQFRTDSDTETLIEYIVHFGLAETLTRVRGMFAFVLYDTHSGELFAVRDHFGQKPLYYFEENGSLAISSSINALLKLKKSVSPNFDSYQTYLCTRGIIHPEDTFFEGINALPAGHLLHKKDRISRNEYFTPWSLYNPEKMQKYENASEADLLDELDGLFGQSVRRHLVSDVPVGVLLSGGIDSSLVYWYAHDLNSDLTSYTKVSPEIESIPFAIVPQILTKKMSNWVVNLERPEIYLDGLVDFTRWSHTPSRWGGGPPMSRLCARARQSGNIVLLGGDCADEYFSGYNEQTNLFERFNGDLNERGDVTGINTNSSYYGSGCDKYLNFQTDTRNRILNTISDIKNPFEKFVQAVLLHDTAVFLQTCNLPHSDAYSMMASVELRNPMLDFDLVEFVTNLPSHKKYSRTNSRHSNKYLLRELGKKHLGEFVDVPKEGTRNYSMKISEPANWDFSKFSLNEWKVIPEGLSKKENFKLINLEIFHRIFFLKEEEPLTDILLNNTLSKV